MSLIKVNWSEHKPTDDNNGFIFGVQDSDDFPNFVQWFKTEKERDYFLNSLIQCASCGEWVEMNSENLLNTHHVQCGGEVK